MRNGHLRRARRHRCGDRGHIAHSHAALTIQLALAGKHVLLEKPIAATVGECVAIRHASAATGVTVLPAHVRRFSPMATWIVQQLASSELSAVRRVRWCEGLEYDWPAVTGFTFEAGAGGGVLAGLRPMPDEACTCGLAEVVSEIWAG